MLALVHSSYVILGKLFNFPVPQLCFLKKDNNGYPPYLVSYYR
jgi:hypothetical protein